MEYEVLLERPFQTLACALSVNVLISERKHPKLHWIPLTPVRDLNFDMVKELGAGFLRATLRQFLFEALSSLGLGAHVRFFLFRIGDSSNPVLIVFVESQKLCFIL